MLFSEFCEFFKNAFLHRTPLVAASGLPGTLLNAPFLFLLIKSVNSPFSFVFLSL